MQWLKKKKKSGERERGGGREGGGEGWGRLNILTEEEEDGAWVGIDKSIYKYPKRRSYPKN